MLTIEARRLTDAERAALTAERASRWLAREREAAATRRAYVDGVKAYLWLAALFAAPIAIYLYLGMLVQAAAVSSGTLFFGGLAAWTWRGFRPQSPLDARDVVRLDAALARGELRTIDIVADAAVVVRGPDRDDEAPPLADVLRIAEGRVIYLPRAACERVDGASLPNTHLRIVCAPGFGIRQVEALGERIEPVAVVDDVTGEMSGCIDTEAIVWIQAEARHESLDLDEGALSPAYYGESFNALAAPLVRGA